ncbi:hypothetical protein CLOM_g24354, partial [Closterium sp. NIES-68]
LSLAGLGRSLDPSGALVWASPLLCSGWTNFTCKENTTITEINLVNMPLSGSLPANISRFKSLERLVIRYSNISGVLPDAITTLEDLEYLDLSYNQIWQPLPPALFTMPKLHTLLLGNNWLVNQTVPNLANTPSSLRLVSLRNNAATVDSASSVGKRTLDLYGNPQICNIDTGLPLLNLSTSSGQFNNSCAWTPAPFCVSHDCSPTHFKDLPAFLNAYPPSYCKPNSGPMKGPLFPPSPTAPAPSNASSPATAQALTKESSASVSAVVASGAPSGSLPSGFPPGAAGPPGSSGGEIAAGAPDGSPFPGRVRPGAAGGAGGDSAGAVVVPTGPGACVCVGQQQYYEFDLVCSNSNIKSWNDDYSQVVAEKLSAGFTQKLKKCIAPEQVWVRYAYVSDWRLDSTSTPVFDMYLYVVLFGNFTSDEEVLVQTVIVQNKGILGDPKFGQLNRLDHKDQVPPPTPLPPFPERNDTFPNGTAPAAPAPDPPSSSSSYTTVIIAVVVVVLAVLFGVGVAYFYFFVRARHTKLSSISGSGFLGNTALSSSFGWNLQQRFVQVYSLKEVAAATHNWDEERVLGQGGYGRVYLGEGAHGVQWAVKRLEARSTAKALQDFRNEVELISQTNHRNLVKLLGFCDDQGEQILVYEFVPNGNLRQHLRPSKAALEHPDAHKLGLTFLQRVDIAVGAAEGLRYLHNFTTPSVVHRDVKSENILLDEDMLPKVADFGFFKNMVDGTSGGKGASEAVSTRVLGTPGYVDPEYYYTCKVTTKCDVYSFGVVLWELITGKSPILEVEDPESGPGDGPCFMQLPIWACMYLKKGNLAEIIDPAFKGDYDMQAIQEMAEIADKCTRDKARHRPEMTDALTRLVEIQRRLKRESDPSYVSEPTTPVAGMGGGGIGDATLDVATIGDDSLVLHSTTHQPPMSTNFGGR